MIVKYKERQEKIFRPLHLPVCNISSFLTGISIEFEGNTCKLHFCNIWVIHVLPGFFFLAIKGDLIFVIALTLYKFRTFRNIDF